LITRLIHGGIEMAPLSMDLRRRIVAAYEAREGSHAALGLRFSVSSRVVGKLVQQYRELGTLEPQVHRRGRKPAISGVELEALKRHVEEFPDATGEERRVALQLNCTTKTVYETLHRLGHSFKKRRRVRPNRIAPMS
jgi:transposase